MTLVCAALMWVSNAAGAQLEPFAPTDNDGQGPDEAARNIWNAALVSAEVIAQQMQEALASAPEDGPERALYMSTWACLVDAAVSPILIDFETAFSACTVWATSPAARSLQRGGKTPYTVGGQNAQTVWNVLLSAQERVKLKWPASTDDQIFAAAVCAADAANAFGPREGLTPARLLVCAHRAGIADEAKKRAARAPLRKRQNGMSSSE